MTIAVVVVGIIALVAIIFAWKKSNQIKGLVEDRQYWYRRFYREGSRVELAHSEIRNRDRQVSKLGASIRAYYTFVELLKSHKVFVCENDLFIYEKSPVEDEAVIFRCDLDKFSVDWQAAIDGSWEIVTTENLPEEVIEYFELEIVEVEVPNNG